MKYTKRQILEALDFWKKQLRRMDEDMSLRQYTDECMKHLKFLPPAMREQAEAQIKIAWEEKLPVKTALRFAGADGGCHPQMPETTNHVVDEDDDLDENNSQKKNSSLSSYAKKGLSMMSRVPGGRFDAALGRLQKAQSQGINPRDAARRASSSRAGKFLGEDD